MILTMKRCTYDTIITTVRKNRHCDYIIHKMHEGKTVTLLIRDTIAKQYFNKLIQENPCS